MVDGKTRPRFYHTCVAVGRKLYSFGGMDLDNVLSHGAVFDLGLCTVLQPVLTLPEGLVDPLCLADTVCPDCIRFPLVS